MTRVKGERGLNVELHVTVHSGIGYGDDALTKGLRSLNPTMHTMHLLSLVKSIYPGKFLSYG